jgi:hypothetical protein
MTALFERRELLADPVLELPDAERGEQEALRAGESADGGQFFLNCSRRIVLPRTAPARFAFAGAARGFAYGEMTGIIHADGKSSFQATAPKGGMEWWSNGVIPENAPAPIHYSTTPSLQPRPVSPLCEALFSTTLPGHVG